MIYIRDSSTEDSDTLLESQVVTTLWKMILFDIYVSGSIETNVLDFFTNNMISRIEISTTMFLRLFVFVLIIIEFPMRSHMRFSREHR